MPQYSSGPYYAMNGRQYDPWQVGGTGYRRETGQAREARDARDQLGELRDYWSKSYSGDMSGDLADVFMAMYGDGKFHGGGIGGVDREMSGGVMNEYRDATNLGGSPFGKKWLGPKDPLVFEKGGTMGMGFMHPEDVKGDRVQFKRPVDPYMMYNYPEDPSMWDELPDPSTPLHRDLTEGENQDWYNAWRGDQQDRLWEMGRKERRTTGSSGLSNILSNQQRGNDFLNRLRRGGI